MKGCTHCKNTAHFCLHNKTPTTSPQNTIPIKEEIPQDTASANATKPLDLESAALLRFIRGVGIPN